MKEEEEMKRVACKIGNHINKLINRAEADRIITGQSQWRFTDRCLEVVDPKESEKHVIDESGGDVEHYGESPIKPREQENISVEGQVDIPETIFETINEKIIDFLEEEDKEPEYLVIWDKYIETIHDKDVGELTKVSGLEVIKTPRKVIEVY